MTGENTMHLDTEKLAKVIQKLSDRVNGLYLSSARTVGKLGDNYVRVEVLAATEAAHVSADTVLDEFNCITDFTEPKYKKLKYLAWLYSGPILGVLSSIFDHRLIWNDAPMVLGRIIFGFIFGVWVEGMFIILLITFATLCPTLYNKLFLSKK